MNPVFASPEGGMVSPVLGADVSQDRDGLAVLNEDGIIVFIGCAMDAVAFMATHGLVQDWDCEIVENRAYSVGLEPF